MRFLVSMICVYSASGRCTSYLAAMGHSKDTGILKNYGGIRSELKAFDKLISVS